MSKFVQLGIASEETKKLWFSLMHMDGPGHKLMFEGQPIRSKPFGQSEGNPVIDPN